MPKANIEALLNAPPNKVSSIPNIPCASLSFEGSIPGRTTKEPNLKMIRIPTVFNILILRSSIVKMFLMVSKNFFINYNAVAFPPAFSIASTAVFENK